MKPILLMTLLAFTLSMGYAQDSLTIEAIDRIVAAIDADKKATKDVYCDDVQLEVMTHYCEEALTDANKGHLFRFTVKTNANTNTITVYYFHQNALVKVINEERSKTKLLKRRVLYVNHDQVIHDVAEGIHPSPDYFLQTAREKVKEIIGTAAQ
ncbi:MAG TPA: hypothetical protein VGE66_08970 [Chitinophagaceae bacterium]